MNLLNLLLLALAYLIGGLFVKRALERTKNDTNNAPRRDNKTYRRHSRGVRTKVTIGRLSGTTAG